MFVYLLAFSSPTIYLLILLKKRNEIHINFDSFKFIHQKNLKKQIISVSSFGLIGGIGTIAVASIDKVMINEYLNLEAIGIYSTSFLFATLVAIPSRTLGKISGALIADSWKNNNLHQIDTIYKKSCLNQLVVGLFIFLLITTNLDVLYNIIPQEYQKGREVILFIGLAKLFDMATGTNGTIISTSKYYRYQSIFVFVLLFFIIGTNIIFIPWMGITGAAIASAISTFLYNTIRFVFLKLKYNLQPFNWRFLAVVAIGFILYYVFNNYMEIDNIIFNFLITSGLITIIYGLFIYLTNISEDITKIIESLLKFKNSSDK
jgi:O-antigen/teichoic acid export membrane protein